MNHKSVFEKTFGWVIAKASVLPDTSSVRFTFERVQSDELFPGLIGQTVSFRGLYYKEAKILPADLKHKDRLITFEILQTTLVVEDDEEYVILIWVDRSRVIWIKSMAHKTHFDAVVQHLDPGKDTNQYHVKFYTGQVFTGTLDRLVRATILQVEGCPKAFLRHSQNEWYLKGADDEFHRILVLPRLDINRMFISAVIRGGIGALPPV